MKRGKKSRKISILLLLCMILSLAACGGNISSSSLSNSSAPEASSSSASSAEPVSTEPKILYLPSASRATSANPYIGSQDADTEIINLITARLYGNIPREDRTGSMLVPMLAAGEPEDISGDGTVWKIEISKDAKWENGEPINADTFIYSEPKIFRQVSFLPSNRGAGLPAQQSSASNLSKNKGR